MKKSIITLFFALIISTLSFGQLSGIKIIGPGETDDYNSVKAAIAALNAQGVGGSGVTFQVPAGWLETFTTPTDGKITTLTGSLSTPIVFRKNGTGANPVITSAAGTGAFDGIITIAGTDYVTFEVARMKTADNYGRSHSVYYNKMDEVADATAKNGKKPRKLKKLAEVNEPLPF